LRDFSESLSAATSPHENVLNKIDSDLNNGMNPVTQRLIDLELQLNTNFDNWESYNRSSWPKVDIPLDVAVRNLSIVSDRFEVGE
jgi:hypothetical protein